MPFTGFGFAKTGVPSAQNFARPSKRLLGRYNTNAVHHLKGNFEFANREATFEVDGASLGKLPFRAFEKIL